MTSSTGAASSTLIIGLDSLSVENLDKIVQARGIDTVVVVANNTAFSGSALASNINSASQLQQNISGDVVFALRDSTTLSLSDSVLSSINSAGLRFLDDPGLTSISGALVGIPSVLQTSGFDGTLPSFDPNAGTTALGSSYTITADSELGTKTTISLSPAGAVLSAFTDLGGSVLVSVSASEFRDYINSSDADRISK